MPKVSNKVTQRLFDMLWERLDNAEHTLKLEQISHESTVKAHNQAADRADEIQADLNHAYDQIADLKRQLQVAYDRAEIREKAFQERLNQCQSLTNKH